MHIGLLQKCFDMLDRAQHNQDKHHLPPVLEHECTPWRLSSQRAADLYDSGVKLWRKHDLAEIERELGQSHDIDRFSLRRIYGSSIQV